jgi:hypothetical protein
VAEYAASNRCDEHDGRINDIRVNCTVAGVPLSVAEDSRGILLTVILVDLQESSITTTGLADFEVKIGTKRRT